MFNAKFIDFNTNGHRLLGAGLHRLDLALRLPEQYVLTRVLAAVQPLQHYRVGLGSEVAAEPQRRALCVEAVVRCAAHLLRRIVALRRGQALLGV